MLTHRFYYGLKPYLPWRVRIAIRRVSAQRKRASVSATWPIDASAATIPPSWPGWPDGKRFALVLTHDVEGQGGLDKASQLAQLEKSLGFRSSFNFIPEGAYRVPSELRRQLAADGFEVGVHDLKHDGKLYQSRRAFEQNAARINRYLQEWGATGFRSGFMLRNLEWLQDLEIQYDSSTFDTDPFEPQSDGAGTIFPFWVPSPSGAPGTNSANGGGTARQRGGYVELPYTLPQDSTLFLVLREQSPEIWINKLDWIVRHGGMAMVNVHPDYTSFGNRTEQHEYPAEFYAAFLRHVNQRYAGQFWNATPQQVNAWYRKHVSKPACNGHPITIAATPAAPDPAASEPLRGKRAAVLLYSNYPADPRPRRAAETMIAAGMSVDLLCLAGADTDPRTETVRGVNVTRVRLQHRRDSRLGYLWQYGRFFLSAFRYLTWTKRSERYDVVHVHNMPDFLVFAAMLPKWRGARVILDLHDPMPELMMSIYSLPSQDWKVRLLRAFERWSIRFANLVLTPNKSFKDLFAARCGNPDKVQIVMNSPEERIFDPDRYSGIKVVSLDRREFRIMHHGSILHRHGVDLLVAAVALARREVPGVCLDIYGFRDPFLDVVLKVAEQVGVDDIVRYHGSRTQDQIADAIRECDVGVVPNRLSPFTNLNFPTRLFEYLSMHRPVIAPKTVGIHDYFSDESLITFEAENVADLAAKIVWVHRNPGIVRERVQRGIAVYRRHLWRNEKAHLTGLVRDLVRNRA